MPTPPAALRGFLSLAWRETWRFLKIWMQTLGAPVVTTLLFLAVFVLALGESHRMVEGVPYLEFLGAGLVVMALSQNAFSNASSSLIIAKLQGNVVDLLMAPLPPWALLGGLLAGAVLRGLAVALVVLAAMWPLIGFRWADPGVVLAAGVLGSALLGLLGILAGLWAQKFDQVATVTNFVVTPLAFLSGTFFSIERLPEPLRRVAHADPLFWMMDAFRAGLTGHADGNVAAELAGLAALVLLLWCVGWWLVRRGWRLRS